MKEYKVPYDRVMDLNRRSSGHPTPDETAASLVFATISSGEDEYNRYSRIFKNEHGRIQVCLVGNEYVVRVFDQAGCDSF